MSYLVRSEFVRVEDGFEFICPSCGTDNEIDEEDLILFPEFQCWSCRRIWAAKDEYETEVRGQGRAWKQDELRYVILTYSGTRAAEIAIVLGRSVSSVYQVACRFGLSKSETFTETIWQPKTMNIPEGKKHRFTAGHIPHNKGKKFDAGGRSRETRFGPGHLPHNTKQDGAITVRVHKRTGISYQWIRVSLGKWQQLHQYTWEQANGKVPSGHIVVFKDRDTMNCKLENLECISRAENMRRNTIHRYPDELKATIRLVNKLERKIKNKTENA